MLAEGEVRRTWITDIQITTVEVEKQIAKVGEEDEKVGEEDEKGGKRKGSKVDSGTDGRTDSDESDQDESGSDDGDPIEKLAGMIKLDEPVIGRVHQSGL